MIVFKNELEEAEGSTENSSNDPILMKINDNDVILTKNYLQIHEKIINLNENKDESKTIKISIPGLNVLKNEVKKKRNSYDDDDDDNEYNEYRESYRHSRSYDYTGCENNYSNVFYSNFDHRDIKDFQSDHYEYQNDYYFQRSYRLRLNNLERSGNYNNLMMVESDLPLLKDFKKSSKSNKKSVAIEQFQLILDGYDIIIPDFIVDDMLKIAEKFQIQDLIDAINPLKEQIGDLNNYNRFSELEILVNLEDILSSINEENFKEETSTIYSIFLYLGNNLFNSILRCFSFIYPKNYQIYLQIAELINSKYHNFSFEINFEHESSSSLQYSTYLHRDMYEYYRNRDEIRVNEDLLEIIKKDDVDSLQALSCNPKFKFANEIVILKLYKNYKSVNIPPICNAIECSAFYGSIKCFKFLLLNEKLDSNNLSQYAVAGGNTEIIHVCEQKKYSFKNTLKIAIDYHQNDIAEWIVDNEMDSIREDIYDSCISSYNFDMLQFFLNRKAESTLDDEKMFAKYILYSEQKYNDDSEIFTLYDFMTKYQCMKFNDDFGLIYCPNEKVELLHKHYNINDPDCSNLLDSPISRAAYHGDLEMCKFLLKHQNLDNVIEDDEDDDNRIMYLLNNFSYDRNHHSRFHRINKTKFDSLKSSIIDDLDAKNV